MNKCIKYVSILIILMAFAATAASAQPVITDVANDAPTNNSVNITWNTNEVSTSLVKYGTVSGAYTADKLGGGTTTSHSIELTGLSADTPYYYVVNSTNTTGGSNQSTEYSFTTASTSDATPPIITDVANDAPTNNSVNITWNTNEVSNSLVKYGTVSGAYTADKLGGGTTTSHSIELTGLSADTPYYYVVNSTDGNSNSNQSMEYSFTTASNSGTTPPASITNLQNTTGETYINWTWTDPGDVTFVVMVYIDGLFKKNVSQGTRFYDATGFTADTSYTISTRTANGSSINTTWVNDTAKTKPLGYSTGNRIWEEGMDTSYLWTAQTFTGFYYDIDDGFSTETLTITGIKQTLDEGSIVYETRPRSVKFDCNKWGTYDVIGFMAEKYFAGYNSGTDSDITDESTSLVSNKMLSKVLIDEDDKHMISIGKSLELKEGYEVKVIDLDLKGDKARIELLRDGKSVDTGIISNTPSTYTYIRDIGSVDDVPVVAINVDSVFAGTKSKMIVIKGIFQISENYKSIKTGETYDEMEIKSAGGSGITMKNDDDISLDEGEIVDLMGNVKFLVADSSTLRFALYKEITTPGTYDIRGTVYNATSSTWTSPIWTPMNFEGFYYNIDEPLGTEQLKIEQEGTSIGDGKLVYTTTVQPVKFDYSGWGTYDVIGFMAEKYFAGYNSGTDSDITDESTSLVSNKMLSKVLIDSDKKYMVSIGASLELKEGYEVRIIQLDVSGDKAQIELLRNGRSVDTGIISNTPSTYTYIRDIGSVDDIPVVVIRVDSVFAGTESDMLVIKGVFQISENYKSVEGGDKYGEMEITSTSSNGITMENEDDISLNEGGKTMIMENVGFMTSDDGERYAPFVRRTVGSIAALTIELPESLIVGEEIVITITADGSPVEGAEVQFAGENLGLTDSNGEVRFTSEEAGTFTITAIKENYDSASVEVRILTEEEADMDPLEITMPDTVKPSEDVVIKVTYEGDAIEGASITWDGTYIGDTDETGSLTYSAEDEGTHTVTANKEGYLEGSEEIEVAVPSAEFELTDFTCPEEVSANKNFAVSVDVTNTGDDSGTYLAELKVNGSVVDSQNVTLDAGDTEKIEFTTKIAEAGTNTIEIGTESGEITVTKTKSNTALIAVVLIVLALLGAIGYLLISSAPEGGWTVGRLRDAIKDKFQRGGKGL